MSRANLLIVVVLILALVGMFFWTLTLHNQQSEMRQFGGRASSGRGTDPAMSGRLEDLELDFDGLEELVRSQIADLGGLERKVNALEATAGEQNARIAALGGGEVVPAAVSSTAGEPAQLEAAIETVLNERAERERIERTKRGAERYAGMLLREVEVNADQKARFVTVMTDYLTSRDEVRKRFSGDNADDQTRDAELARMDQNRNDQFLTILGVANYQKVEERLNRSSRAPQGRGGNRGNRGGGRGR